MLLRHRPKNQAKYDIDTKILRRIISLLFQFAQASCIMTVYADGYTFFDLHFKNCKIFEGRGDYAHFTENCAKNNLQRDYNNGLLYPTN